MEHGKVLIVDDEADVVQSLQFRLRAAGYETLTASDGAEALQVLRRNKVDLVLSDLLMPRVDGVELTRRVKSDSPKMKVVLFSCANDEAFRARALASGALDYLPKAGGAKAILDRVREILQPEPSAPEHRSETLAADTAAHRALLKPLAALSRSMAKPHEPRAFPVPTRHRKNYGAEFARSLASLARALHWKR